MAKVTAVIDIGSNSARMAIFEKTSHLGFHLLYEGKSKVRISQNTYAHNGYLQETPMQRAIAALKDFLYIAKLHKARKILCVATSAVRDAPNKAVFLKLAREIGLKIKVISGESEAYFGAIAALNLLPQKSGLTIDIGGGSTELALIENQKIIDKISLNLGTIRLKELFLDKGDIKGAKDFIKHILQDLPQQFCHTHIFGIGGSARAISKAVQEHIDYPLDTLHAFSYNFIKHKDFIKKLYLAEADELLKLGIKEDRLDSIKGGALIFHTLLNHFSAKEVITSGVGVREGVFLHHLLRNENGHFPHNFNPSVRSLKDRFLKDSALTQAKIKKYLANKLIDATQTHNLIPNDYKNYLSISTELSNIGISLNFYEKNRHTNYILLNGLNYGLTHKDRLIISTLARFANKKIPESLPFLELLGELNPLRILGFFMSICEILSKNPLPKEFKFNCIKESNGYALEIYHPALSYLAKENLNKLNLPEPFTRLA
ncbi:MAG: Ppx/GppA phosphatase family protein [Helicobacter sp.]|nr:Ppx/GppA phosphatase family protein [Helicobacter sp.]